MNNRDSKQKIKPDPLEALHALSWPGSQLPQAMQLLARKSRFLAYSLDDFDLTFNWKQPFNDDDMVVNQYIEQITDWLNLEVELIKSPYPQIEQLLKRGGPALFQLPNPDNTNAEPRFLLLFKSSWGRIAVIAPDATVQRLKTDTVRAGLAYLLETPLLPEIEQFLSETDLPQSRWPQARRAFLRQRLSQIELTNCWFLRPSPATSLRQQARRALIPHYLVLTTLLQAIDTILSVAIIGIAAQGALEGRVEWGWIIAGILLIFTKIPFSVVKIWVISLFGVAFGRIIKQRLFYGVLHLNTDEVQHKGAGQFLAWAMEAEKLEATSTRVVNNGFRAAVSIPIFAVILAFGAGGIWHGLLLIGWSIGGIILAWLGFASYLTLSQNYSEMTNDILERISGHQTRLVQEDPKHWHDEEDATQAHYLTLTEKDDRNKQWIMSVIPYGWMVVGIFGIIYPFLTVLDPIALGTSFLAILMTGLFLQVLSYNLIDITNLVVSWRLMKPIFEAAEATTTQGGKTPVLETPQPGQLILSANKLSFSYPTRDEPVLNKCTLQVYAGDRLLLEGPSGGGKSTLALTLINLYVPQSGLLLLRGFDQHTIKPAIWRQHIVAAPQFHENHILGTSFAFNLLMGRRWPALPEDLAEAEEVCRELGLGDLLDRMPLGLQQPVGEEGWRLSHGERSRVYIARTLLQQADMIILDESFASLDPESMEIALRCVLKRAPTLMVIAHP